MQYSLRILDPHYHVSIHRPPGLQTQGTTLHIYMQTTQLHYVIKQTEVSLVLLSVLRLSSPNKNSITLFLTSCGRQLTFKLSRFIMSAKWSTLIGYSSIVPKAPRWEYLHNNYMHNTLLEAPDHLLCLSHNNCKSIQTPLCMPAWTQE